ncbi:MAG: MFS transporter [Thermofilum sp.]|jgi:MFS family permease|uniref:spinster family MFS transporter n=1 Tax=Thermofilum sp. TaxID=1961369 RepID=UPI0025849501|nr:MFS transporter [Thermofilum sp.]MCI4409697.1 MFS transporter [Thermofilum sp.]
MTKKYKWFIVIFFFIFLTMHEADRFIISAVAPQVMDEFKVTYSQLGLVFSLTVLVAALLYPVWGYLYDRYSRKVLAGLAALIWGFTTIFNALSRTFGEFFATRLATGIDDAAPPGIYSLVADYFEPYSRGKALGILNASGPLGAIIGTILSLSIVSMGLSWRNAFFITGPIGVIIGILTFFVIKDIPRGSSEPELQNLLEEDIYKAKFSDLPRLLKNRSLILLYLQGFWGVFPWNAITFWFVTYMEKERGMAPDIVMVVMSLSLIAMVIGNLVAGVIGDWMFKKTKRGRAIFGAIVVFFSAVLIYLAIRARTNEEFMLFTILTAFEIPMAGPNVVAAITDITEPELRSSATGYLRFFENLGSAASPFLSGLLAESIGLGEAILWISVSTWLLCFVFFSLLAITIPRDVDRLRSLMKERAEKLKGG